MADEDHKVAAAGEDEEETPGYKAPAQKSLEEIQNMDTNDESLKKYKEALLAGAKDMLDGVYLCCLCLVYAG